MDTKERRVGTCSRGIRCPIIREGDDIAKIVADSVLEAAACEGFALRDRDVISVTESVVARAQGNYATVDDIAADVKAKLGGGTVGVIFPILSRNRFAICLRGIAKGAKKIVLMLQSECLRIHISDMKRTYFRDGKTLQKIMMDHDAAPFPFFLQHKNSIFFLFCKSGKLIPAIFFKRRQAVTCFASSAAAEESKPDLIWFSGLSA